ncbi:MAG: 30S ribosomal protein S8 [Mycoplasma sp.]|nr:30S ribosomal protein S8 [Mycoplasma sp.]
MGIITDPIGDLLIRIKNSNQRKYRLVHVPHSNIKEKITQILLDEGYIAAFKVQGEGVKKELVITLKYKGTQKVISGVKRISKPGLKVYSTSTKIPYVLSGFGIAIISTSKGIITDKEARSLNVGGEVLAFVW